MIKSEFDNFYLSKHPYGGSVLDDIKKQNLVSPYILEERKLHVTQMDVFSRLMMDRVIFFGDEVNSDTCNIVNAQLLYLNSVDPESTISLYINSPGGSVMDGLGVIDTMNFIDAKVSTICTGLAASMGAMLLSSGERGLRYALPNSSIMIHQPLGGARGQASDIEIEAKEIMRLKKLLFNMLAENCNQPIEKIWSDSDRNYWMTAPEAVEYGLIDQVIMKKK